MVLDGFASCAAVPPSCQPIPVTASIVGTTMPIAFRATPSSCRRAGSHCCWIQRSATTEAVLQAMIASVQPSANRRSSAVRSEEHTSELQSLRHLVCRLLLEKTKTLPLHEDGTGGQRTTAQTHCSPFVS